MEVVYTEDGAREQIVSDESWKATRGPIISNDIYDGEEYDARLELPGWASAGFDDSAWEGVQRVEWNLGSLIAPMGPPVRRTELVAPKKIFQSPTGRTLLDFGQNLVGRLRLKVSGPAGQTITLRHAEVLENGELGTRPLRHARATDRYILRGAAQPETWEPRFTFHGFRYAEVDGWPGELKTEDIQAVVCHSDMERTGWFECSNALVNQLHQNVVWSMRGNFFDIPTDCPQRDERLGWTGDIQVFSPTASFLYNSAGFLSSWLGDLAAEQKELGPVQFVVPSVMPKSTPPAAAWGDAAAVIPWVIYERFGDVKILADQFESMRTWVDLIDSIAGEGHLWDQGFQFGDWLDPAAPPDKPGDARTPGFMVASAYFARSAEITGQAAQVLGKTQEAAHYLDLAGKVRGAFNREYVSPAGRLMSDSATAYAMALQFALLPDEAQRQHAAKRLVSLVRTSGFRISTGFVGTPLICDALCSQGYTSTAYRLLTQTECPSWLYPVTMGATTIWERWDSMLPDGSINPGEMTFLLLPASSSMPAAFCNPGWQIWLSNRLNWAVLCLQLSPIYCHLVLARLRRPGRMPRWLSPGCFTSALATRASWLNSLKACGPGWTMWQKLPVTAISGQPVSSSATGLIQPPRLTNPGWPARINTLSPARISLVQRNWLAGQPGCWGVRPMKNILWPWQQRCARLSLQSLSLPLGV